MKLIFVFSVALIASAQWLPTRQTNDFSWYTPYAAGQTVTTVTTIDTTPGIITDPGH